MKKILNASLKLIEVAGVLGLDEIDLKNAREFLTYNEFGLCFDTIVTQMYEYDIEIDKEFYQLIAKIGEMMELEQEDYSFMQELIRDESNIPKPVKEELVRIIANFQ